MRTIRVLIQTNILLGLAFLCVAELLVYCTRLLCDGLSDDAVLVHGLPVRAGLPVGRALLGSTWHALAAQ